MKYFKVTAKCGHVGKNNYYKGDLYIKAESKKDAAKKARYVPRVKHDHKDAILNVQEIDLETFEMGRANNRKIHYYTCENRQEQNNYFHEIEDKIYEEESVFDKRKKYAKSHSLKKVYNSDPTYDMYKKHNGLINLEFTA